MIDKTTKKSAVIVDGVLSCAVKGNKDLFGDHAPKVDALVKKLDQARDDVDVERQNNILQVFRTEVDNFTAMVGTRPTTVLMNYRDVNLMCKAFNTETITIGVDRPYIDTYSSSDSKRIIDGIKIKKGCDQEPGQIRFYSAESSDIIIGS